MDSEKARHSSGGTYIEESLLLHCLLRKKVRSHNLIGLGLNCFTDYTTMSFQFRRKGSKEITYSRKDPEEPVSDC